MVHLRATVQSTIRQDQSGTIGDAIDGKKISTKLSLKKMLKIVGNLTPTQQGLVKECGFGSILSLKCTQLPRELVALLARWTDCNTRTVNIPNAGSFELNPYTVHQILGIPLGGLPINKTATEQARAIIAEDTGEARRGPSISALTDLVTNDLEGAKFKRVFMLLLLSTFLCPTSYSCASPEYYNAVAVVGDISSYDWCTFVLDWLFDKLRNFKIAAAKPTLDGKETALTLGGCVLIPVMAFFDYVHGEYGSVSSCLPRLSVWDDKAINLFDNLNFTSLTLKDIRCTPFFQRTSTPSATNTLPNGVEEFIDALAPSDNHAAFRANMKQMCTRLYTTCVDKCISALHPILEKEMKKMATDFWTRTNNGSSTSTRATISQPTAPEANVAQGDTAEPASTQRASAPTSPGHTHQHVHQVATVQNRTHQHTCAATPTDHSHEHGKQGDSLLNGITGEDGVWSTALHPQTQTAVPQPEGPSNPFGDMFDQCNYAPVFDKASMMQSIPRGARTHKRRPCRGDRLLLPSPSEVQIGQILQIRGTLTARLKAPPVSIAPSPEQHRDAAVLECLAGLLAISAPRTPDGRRNENNGQQSKNAHKDQTNSRRAQADVQVEGSAPKRTDEHGNTQDFTKASGANIDGNGTSTACENYAREHAAPQGFETQQTSANSARAFCSADLPDVTSMKGMPEACTAAPGPMVLNHTSENLFAGPALVGSDHLPNPPAQINQFTNPNRENVVQDSLGVDSNTIAIISPSPASSGNLSAAGNHLTAKGHNENATFHSTGSSPDKHTAPQGNQQPGVHANSTYQQSSAGFTGMSAKGLSEDQSTSSSSTEISRFSKRPIGVVDTNSSDDSIVASPTKISKTRICPTKAIRSLLSLHRSR